MHFHQLVVDGVHPVQQRCGEDMDLAHEIDRAQVGLGPFVHVDVVCEPVRGQLGRSRVGF